MNSSKIEWTETTWNPSTGCTKISAGCKNCYAEKMAKRLRAMGQKKYQNGFDLTVHPDVLKNPYTWTKNRMVFVNSMSDLFHEDMPFEFICEVFKVMNENQQHTFQILTKRADILFSYADNLNWTSNIWMGVTVENQENVFRVDFLKRTNAFLKFLSIEPLIGEISNIDLNGIDWVIVGGESGIGSRPMSEEWVLSIKDKCFDQDVPFFFKQWGGVNKKKNGRTLKGKEWNAIPNTEIIASVV